MTLTEIGSKLRELRNEKGMPLTAVADQVYYTEQQISFMERAQKMSVQSLMALLDFYGYEISIVKKGEK